jgi:hypothetical protein
LLKKTKRERMNKERKNIFSVSPGTDEGEVDEGAASSNPLLLIFYPILSLCSPGGEEVGPVQKYFLSKYP